MSSESSLLGVTCVFYTAEMAPVPRDTFAMARTVKDEVRRLVDRLPEDATWADAADLVLLHERLAHGRKDSAEGRKAALKDVETEFGSIG